MSLLNAQSVRNKSCHLRDYVTDNDIDILCLSETWLSDIDCAAIAALTPETHVLHHVPRLDKRGGGVGCLITKSLRCKNQTNKKFDTFECMEIKLSSEKTGVTLNIIYRPPQSNSSTFLQEIQSLILDNETHQTNVIYLGDFNMWVDDNSSNDALGFLELLDTFNLKNYVNEPTCRSGHTLDLVITKKQDPLVSDLKVDNISVFSDHRTITFKLNLDCVKTVNKLIQFRKRNSEMADRLLSELEYRFTLGYFDCQHRENHPCVQCSTQYFRVLTKEVYENCCPLIEKNISVKGDSNKWYNTEIKVAKRNCRRAERKYRRNKNEANHNEFKRLSKIKCNLVTHTKGLYYNSKIKECGNNSSKVFSYLNELLGKNKTTCILPSHTSSIDLANDFKQFFIQKIDTILHSFQSTNSPSETIEIPDLPISPLNILAPVTVENVCSYVSKMNKTYCFNDTFDISLFEPEQIQKLALYFCEIINNSFGSGIFPECEKMAYVRPMIKKDSDQDLMKSYRPLYNTSFLSKLLEYACLQQLQIHLQRFDCIPQFQSAYRKFHSVETALCRVYNDLICTTAEGDCSILILLDLSAAFDTVDQDALLLDLQNLGITGLALSWFETYLKNRKFKVTINGKHSEPGCMKYGVPQGTILGPMLFVVYTLTLQYILEFHNVSYHFYADDTQIYFKCDTKDHCISKLNVIIQAVQSWMHKRKLKLNTDKTNVMVVGNTQKLRNLDLPGTLLLDQTDVNLSSKLKNLGVILDQNLTLNYQITAIKKKTIGGLINIAKISNFIDFKSKFKLVHCLVLSHLDFCNSILYELPDYQLHSLQMILNAAVRIIVNMPRFSTERVTPKAIELHFLPIKARIEYKICLLVHKTLLSGQPKYLFSLLKPVTNSNLRSCTLNRLVEPFLSRQVKVNRSFAHCAPRLYNKLPHSLRTITSTNSFKKHLKTFLFRKAYNLDTQEINEDYKV